MSTSKAAAKRIPSEMPTPEVDKAEADEAMRKAKAAAEIAKKEKGNKITEKPTREYLLLYQLHSTVQSEQTGESGSPNTLTTTITSEHPPCDLEFSELRPIPIKDLLAETIHEGRCLILRTISVPIRRAPLILVAEDHSGDATLVTLFNMNIDCGDDQRYMAVNTYFVIRAPFYKMSAVGLYSVRVDHPSDCVRMSPGHSFLHKNPWDRPEYNARHVETDALKLKEKGRQYFNENNFQAALDMYNTALENMPHEPESELWRKLFCNRALTELKMARFDGVLNDTLLLLTHYPDARRPLFLQARAYYNLRSFDCARRAWDAYLRLSPNDKEAQKHMKSTMARLDEQRNGTYNFRHMAVEANESKFPRLDYGDYLTVTEVRKSKLVKDQRGLFAKKDFKQGELVLCEKAFRICYKDEIVSQTTINTVRTRLHRGPDSRLPSLITQTLFDNPSLAPRFFNLYSRRKSIVKDPIPPLKNGEPLIDAFTVASIVEANAFKVEKHARIIRGHDKVDHEPNNAGNDCGVWIQASYINHSCTGNVSRAFVGDVMVIRARRAIKTGEELFHTYIPPTDSAAVKKKSFKAFGFTCKCELCKIQNAIPEEENQRRQAIVKQFDDKLRSIVDDKRTPSLPLVRELKAILNRALDTYTTRRYCFDLIRPYEILFGMNYYLCRYQECIRDLRQILQLITGTDIGNFDSFQPKVWSSDIITLLVQFCVVLEDTGDFARAEKCQRILQMVYGNFSGMGSDFSPYDMILDQYKQHPGHTCCLH
ncbi:hypothetical protein FQN54_005962 [Arachnomyces sp. PD_36]|nr:hypothetical protein FQN54_005962 [Arachnomyces sp. PD_36]